MKKYIKMKEIDCYINDLFIMVQLINLQNIIN